MKFELTLYMVIVFLVPGFIATGSIGLWSGRVHALIEHSLTAPDAANGIALLVLAFGIGAVIDALRSLFVEKLLDVGSTKLSADYLKKLSKDNIEVFQFLVERSHEYYRLNANTALAATVFAVSYAIRQGCNATLLLLLTLTALFWVNARKSRKETILIMKAFAEGAK
jgi:hypothetical protein